MHMGDAVWIGVAILGHAWITRIQGPPQVVNVAAWVFGVVATVLVWRLAL